VADPVAPVPLSKQATTTRNSTMTRWFRSEPMEYISLIVNEDAAHDCLGDLGKLGVIQFTDVSHRRCWGCLFTALVGIRIGFLTPPFDLRINKIEQTYQQLNPDLTPFQRRYVSYVKRCDELERKLRFFNGEIDKFDLEIISAGNVDAFVMSNPESKKSGSQLLESLEVELDGYESQLRELNTYSEKLTTEYNEKVELQEVLEKSRRFFMTDAPRLAVSELTSSEPNGALLESDNAPRPELDMRFSSITGVVATEEKSRFERMIFRATRGNCYVRFAPIRQPIADPATGALVEKSVFIIFYKSESIELKLKRICDAFDAHRYSLPDMDDGGAVDKVRCVLSWLDKSIVYR
jgi:V-type H+-transporting ATPase subunit a